MDELENLVRIQQSVNSNSDLRLPILEQTTSGYYPASKRDMYIIRQEIVQRACKTLPNEKIFIRGKTLFDLKEKEPIEKIPHYLYSELFNSHAVRWEVNEQQEAIGKNGFKQIKNIKKFQDETIDIGILRADIENLSVTKQIINNNLIPELAWNNEIGCDNCYTPPMPEIDSISMETARTEFLKWKTWMLANAIEQWNFFEMALHCFCFSNISKSAERKIMVGIGANGGGKGSLIKMLECMPNFRSPDAFGFSDLDNEYRSGEAFQPGSTLTVCHEYQLKQKLDNSSVGLIKSATRGEPIGIRSVGSSVKKIKFYGGIILFCNSTADKKTSINTAHRYFAEWLAYDRFNIVFFDWFFRYPRSEILRGIFDNINSKLAQALGIQLWEYAQEIKSKSIEFYQIPTEFKAEVSGEYGTKYEQLLENLLETWGELHKKINSLIFEDRYPSIEEQVKLAITAFSPLFKEKTLLNKEFIFVEKSEYGEIIKPAFTSSTINQMVERVGGNRKWQVPPRLEDYIEKNLIFGKNRDRIVTFSGTEYLDKN